MGLYKNLCSSKKTFPQKIQLFCEKKFNFLCLFLWSFNTKKKPIETGEENLIITRI